MDTAGGNLPSARTLADALRAVGNIPTQLPGLDQTDQLLAATQLNTMGNLGASNLGASNLGASNLGTSSLSALLGVPGASAYRDNLTLGLAAASEGLARPSINPSLSVSLSSALTMTGQLARQRAIQQAISGPTAANTQEQQLRLLHHQQLLQQQQLLLHRGVAHTFAANGAVPVVTNDDILNMTGLRNQKKATGKGSRPKKPKDMPRRPLSAYNIFFKEERAKILGSANSEAASQNDEEGEDSAPTDPQDRKSRAPHGKIGFENLAKTIGRRWKSLDPTSLERYKALANEEMERYRRRMDDYRVTQVEKRKQELIIIEEKKADAPSSSDEPLETAAKTPTSTPKVEENKGKRKHESPVADEPASAPAEKKNPEQFQRSYLKRMKLNNPFAPSGASTPNSEKEEANLTPPVGIAAPPRSIAPSISGINATPPGIGTNALLAQALAVRSGFASQERQEQRSQSLAAASSLLSLPRAQNAGLPLNRMRFHLP